MGLHEYVGDRDLVLEVGPLTRVPRIFVPADEVPGPAVKGAFDDMRRVLERRVVACPVAGWIVMPWQLRNPVATIFMFLPSGSNDSTSARSSSVSHAAPSGLSLTHAARPSTLRGAGCTVQCGSGNMSCATFDPEPTDRNSRLPSGEKAMSRP